VPGQPYAIELGLCFAADGREAAEAMFERIVAGLPPGVISEGGIVEPMDAHEVLPGSPLAQLLAE
jgi:hypothetical protein